MTLPDPTTGEPSQDLHASAASGITWTTALSLAGRLMTLAAQLILAKILLPEDFGVIGLAYTISSFFNIMAGFGVDQVFQQRYPRMHLWTTQTFAISLALSSAMAIAMAVYAPIGAEIYHNPKVTSVVWVIAASLPLGALATVPMAYLKARMRFKFIAVYTSAELLAVQTATILLAWAGLGALSFVLPLPFAAVIRAIVFWRAAPLALRPMRRSKGWKKMMRQGMSVFAISLLVLCIGQGDYVTLGILASAHVVGIYYFAFRLASQPVTMIASNFCGVLRASLVLLNGRPAEQKKTSFKMAEILGLAAAPICLLQAALAGPGLTLLFGERWQESIPLIQILSIGLSLDAISWAAGSYLEARGEFSKSFRYQLYSAPLFFIFVGTGAWLASATGVAIGVCAYYIIHPVYLTFIVFHKAGIGAGRIFRCFYRPFLLGAVCIGGPFLASKLPLFHGHLIAQLVWITLASLFLYIVGLRFTAHDIYCEGRNKLHKVARRVFKRI